jgi:predicted AlkP superfamily pyrophosphatase or phosphodiesterase
MFHGFFYKVWNIVDRKVGQPVRLTVRRNLPIDMDWDGRSRGYEAIDTILTIRAEELREDQTEKVEFMASS